MRIRPGITVRTLTGKTGTVLATNVPTTNGKHEPTKRINVRLAPFLAQLSADTAAVEITCLDVIYQLDDLIAIGPDSQE